MAIALVQSVKKVVTGVNNTTLAYTSNLTAGNLALAAHAHFLSDSITTPTDTLAQTWVGAVAEQGGVEAVRLRSFYVENCSGGADTVTFDMNGVGTGDLTVVLAEFSGAVTTTALGVTASGTGTTTTGATSGSTGTLDQADGMLWGAIMHDGADTTITQVDGATLVQENEGGSANMPIGTSDELTTATTAQSAIWDFGASRTYFAHVAFFKAAAAGGRTTKNTRAWPLGTVIGMGWRQECGGADMWHAAGAAA